MSTYEAIRDVSWNVNLIKQRYFMYDTLLWACKILSLQFHTISATSQAILLLFVGSGASCRDGSYHVISCHVPIKIFQVACINGGGVYPGFMAIYAIFIGKFVHLHGILWGTFSNKFVSTSPPSRLRSGCVKMLFEFLHHSRYSSATSRIRLKFPQTAGNDEASRCSHSRTFMTLLEGFDPPQRYIMIHIYIYITHMFCFPYWNINISSNVS